MTRVNMKVWDILILNVNTPQLQHVFWRSMTRVNMKEWNCFNIDLNIFSMWPKVTEKEIGNVQDKNGYRKSVKNVKWTNILKIIHESLIVVLF